MAVSRPGKAKAPTAAAKAGPVTLKHLAARLAKDHQLTKRAGEAILGDLVSLITKHLKQSEQEGGIPAGQGFEARDLTCDRTFSREICLVGDRRRGLSMSRWHETPPTEFAALCDHPSGPVGADRASSSCRA